MYTRKAYELSSRHMNSKGSSDADHSERYDKEQNGRCDVKDESEPN